MKDQLAHIPTIDIIILSYAKTDAHKKITEDSIRSLVVSEYNNDIKFNIYVLESNKKIFPYQYQCTQTIYPDEAFGFNKYLNIGLKLSSSETIAFCNNDLIYYKHWATEILNVLHKNPDISSASPICPVHHPTQGILLNSGLYFGYEVRKHFAGWCFVVRRKIFEQIGLFDEKFIFWYADNDFCKVLEQYNLKHVLVSNAVVEHLESATLKNQAYAQRERLTAGQKEYFLYKWKHKNYLKYRSRMILFEVNMQIRHIFMIPVKNMIKRVFLRNRFRN